MSDYVHEFRSKKPLVDNTQAYSRWLSFLKRNERELPVKQLSTITEKYYEGLAKRILFNGLEVTHDNAKTSDVPSHDT